MSPMEEVVYKHLKAKGLKFFREVEFTYCINPVTNTRLRYDFYVPSLNLLIEYDGKAYHESAEVKARDAVKDKFAKDNKIRLVRICAGGMNYFVSKYLSNKPAKSKQPKPNQAPAPKRKPPKKRVFDNPEYKKIDYIKPKPKEVPANYRQLMK